MFSVFCRGLAYHDLQAACSGLPRLAFIPWQATVDHGDGARSEIVMACRCKSLPDNRDV
jgi:hypothetical protein